MNSPISEHDLKEIADAYIVMATASKMNAFRLWDDLGRPAGGDDRPPRDDFLRGLLRRGAIPARLASLRLPSSIP